MKALDTFEVWLITGSQHLYGETALQQVAEQSRQVAAGLDAAAAIPVSVVHKQPVTSPRVDPRACSSKRTPPIGASALDRLDAHLLAGEDVDRRARARCRSRSLHLHTQFNRDLPWAEIDMDFMNLNQSAHGDREFGFLADADAASRRKTVVGHWTRPERRSSGSGRGRARPAAGTRRSRCGSPASATTCARSRSRRATRSRRRFAWASRSTATASASLASAVDERGRRERRPS